MDVFDPQKLDRQALKLFTDREIYRDAFWKTYDSLENGRSEVIYFYGVGGIGKSSLLEQIQRELEEHGNKNYVGYNFEKKEPKVCVLYDISRQLMKKYKKLQFPVFEHALVKYYNLIQEDGYVRQMLEKKGLLENHLVENSINAAGDVVPLTGLAFSIIKEMRNLYKYWKNKAKEKGDKAKYYKEISEFGQAKDLEKNLEHYFSIDAYDFLFLRLPKWYLEFALKDRILPEAINHPISPYHHLPND